MSENQESKITSALFKKTDGYIELPVKPFEIKNAKNMLVISDLHFQFHAQRAINTALDYRKDADVIMILGDLFDFTSLSRFRKTPNLNFLLDELNIGKSFLIHLREKFPKARIIFYEGNHDQRFDHYIIDNAPAMFGLSQMTLSNYLGLKNMGIEFIRNGTFMNCGELYFMHGNEIKCGGVNASRSMLLKTFDNVLFAHSHKTQISSAKSISGKEFATFLIGCLCGLKPLWNPGNDWNWGFGFVEFYRKEFEVFNKRILSNYNIR